ncbi:hypothetical protein NC651_024683 [Populus alba x Populus x berolinensis]|nr:hypothetical protein NC651_024683 [Populus alba x Populus x berolinensis]
MVNVMDQDQQWLLSCLNTTLDPNQETRSFAEASLQPVCCRNNHSILALLADTVIEFQEQAIADDDRGAPGRKFSQGWQSLVCCALLLLHHSAELRMANSKQWQKLIRSGNLVNYLADFFAKFVQSDKQLFDHLCQFGTGSAGCYTNIFTIVSCVFGVRRIGSYVLTFEGDEFELRASLVRESSCQ